MNHLTIQDYFTPEALADFAQATVWLNALPKEAFVTWGGGSDAPPFGGLLRCHEVARAVGRLLDRPVQDGWYGHIDHSWIWLPEEGRHPTILDVLAVAQLPCVQIVLGIHPAGHYSAGSGPSLYRESRPRTDIRDDVVERLITFWRTPCART